MSDSDDTARVARGEIARLLAAALASDEGRDAEVQRREEWHEAETHAVTNSTPTSCNDGTSFIVPKLQHRDDAVTAGEPQPR